MLKVYRLSASKNIDGIEKFALYRAEKIEHEAKERHEFNERASVIDGQLAIAKKLKAQTLDLVKKNRLRAEFDGKIITPKQIRNCSEEVFKITALKKTIVAYLLEVVLFYSRKR